MRRNLDLGTMIGATLMAIWVLFTPLTAIAVNVGDRAPDFLTFSTVGESVRLSDYQGKKNVLLFFFYRAFGGV
jgi:AhpC/TSA family protein